MLGQQVYSGTTQHTSIYFYPSCISFHRYTMRTYNVLDLWCRGGRSGPHCQVSLWNLLETHPPGCHGKVFTRRRLIGDNPLPNPLKKVPGKLLATGWPWPPCGAGTLWRGCTYCKGQALGKLGALLSLPASPLELEIRTLFSYRVSPAPSTDKTERCASWQKNRYLEGPDPFSCIRPWRENLELRALHR